MTKSRDYSSGVLLFLVAAASLLPFLAIGTFLLFKYVSFQRETSLEQVTVLADSLSASVDRKLTGYLDTLHALGSSQHLAEGEIKRFAEMASVAASTISGHFSLIDREGRQLVNTRDPDAAVLPRSADPEGFQRVFASREWNIGDLFEGSVHSGYIFAVRTPITIGSEVRYALGYIPLANTVLSVVRESTLPRDWFAAVLDRNGRIVARSWRHEEFYGKRASTEFLLRLSGQSGRIESVDLEGRETVTAYRESGQTGWRTVVWVPKHVLQAPANTALMALSALTVATLLASLLVAHIVGRLIRRPTRALLQAAHDLGAGKDVRFEESWMREANVIGQSLAEASQDVRLYMRELSHRSKNLLAVVQSISRQTSRSAVDLKDFGRRFDDRLGGLARSHDLLVERNWDGVLLSDLVTAQLEAFIDKSDPRVQLSGGAVLLKPAAAQHIGLAIHELATNASKYGALSAPAGIVNISWTKVKKADGSQRFRLTWQERMGPPVTTPARKGFGRFVIEDAVARGLAGSAQIHWEPNGLVWTLEAPTTCLLSTDPFELVEPTTRSSVSEAQVSVGP